MKIQLFELDLTEEEKKFWRPKFKNFFLINDKKIYVPEDIWKVEAIGDICLVNFRSDSEQNCRIKGYDRGRNIWAFNERGEKIWEIEDAGESIVRQKISNGSPRERFYENGELKMGHTDTYIGYGVGKPGTEYEGKIGVTTHCSFDGELDIKTGKVSNWIQGK